MTTHIKIKITELIDAEYEISTTIDCAADSTDGEIEIANSITANLQNMVTSIITETVRDLRYFLRKELSHE